MHALVLKDADHLEAGAVADVRQPAVRMAAERPLIDAALGRAVEQRAPGLELADPVGSLLGVDLRHAPIVVHFAAAHRIAEMHAPVVFLHHRAKRRRRAAFGHDRVRLAEERFADEGDLGALGAGFDRGAQAGAAGTDHHDVVVVRAEVGRAGSH